MYVISVEKVIDIKGRCIKCEIAGCSLCDRGAFVCDKCAFGYFETKRVEDANSIAWSANLLANA